MYVPHVPNRSPLCMYRMYRTRPWTGNNSAVNENSMSSETPVIRTGDI